jgi:hypothetical protein
VTTWVSPWGELLHLSYEVIQYKDTRATKEEWKTAHKVWQKTLPKIQ